MADLLGSFGRLRAQGLKVWALGCFRLRFSQAEGLEMAFKALRS